MESFLEIAIGFIGHLIRTLVRFIKLRRSETWPVEKGKLLSASCTPTGYGEVVAEFSYAYIHKGEYYCGVDTKGFMLRSAAEEHVGRFPPIGCEIPIRVNP